tara:strand:- start:6457 stop:7236 length:780 start_codon:yes stop_codon:yes gene_type:complete
MASVKPLSIDQIKLNLLNPALTSHFHATIGKPFNDVGFNEFLADTGAVYFSNQGKLNLQCCEAQLPGSQLATTEILNDFPGVTERHVYRRQFDDRIDLNFYCDAEQYLPIRFFESWLKYITNEKSDESLKENYSYRMKFPNTYKGPLEITKFEKNSNQDHAVKPLTYKFVNCFPLAISSMPVTYDSSDLLKCNVSFAYSRYYIDESTTSSEFRNPAAQANYNNVSNGFPIGGLVRSAVQKSGIIGRIAGKSSSVLGRFF